MTINEIASFTSTFYSDDGSEDQSAIDQPLSVTVDRALLAKVWTWLGRHPDVSIGDDREYNSVPLVEVEIQFPGYVDNNVKDGNPSALDSDSDDSQDRVDTPKSRRTTRRPPGSNGPRLHLNEERIYRAICGHPPDPRKVVPLEFDLLSHIAAARSQGILQGELVRATGQDKRSVPKRTDVLHKKGYIVKETVYRKGTRTSRLTLKKFTIPAAINGSRSEYHNSSSQQGSSVRDVVRRIFEVLSGKDLVPQTTLAEELSLKSPAGLSALLKIVRRLERLKCVKRVRTAVGPSATSGDVKSFVQLLRPAELEDLQTFDTGTLSLDQPVEELISLVDPESQNDSITVMPAAENDEEGPVTTRDSARWNPDGLMPNTLLNAARVAGANGLSNWVLSLILLRLMSSTDQSQHARQMITGPFVRRTMEAMLGRISSQSLIVQPPHLRHLAIIRTGLIVDGIAQYFHYSWNAFLQKVKEHDIDISQIPGARQSLDAIKAAEHHSQENDQTFIRTDHFGFPLESPPDRQLKNGEANLSDLITATAPGDVLPRNGEPVVVKEGESFVLKLRELPKSTNEATPRKAQQIRQPQPPKQKLRKDSQEIAKGRPRKYLRGTEKFWRQQFKNARQDTGATTMKGFKGIMDDPSGLALYARRPAGFDETLVQAIDAGLPVPALPDEINDGWVRSTRAVLSRTFAGVYISPSGTRSENIRQASQIMIVKTSRLKSVDFSDRDKPYPFRFISSSAAHSFTFRRYYPSPPVAQSISQQSPVKARRKTRPTRPGCEGHGVSGPPRGIFYEDLSLSKPSLPATLPDIDVPIETFMDTTDEETGFQQSTQLSRSVSASPTLLSSRTHHSDRTSRASSQQTTHHQDKVDSTPVRTVSNPPESSQTLRSSRRRIRTEKALDLVDSDQRRNFRLFSRSMSVDDVAVESDLRDTQPAAHQPQTISDKIKEQMQSMRPSTPSPADIHKSNAQIPSRRAVVPSQWESITFIDSEIPPAVDRGSTYASNVVSQGRGNKMGELPGSTTPILPFSEIRPDELADAIDAKDELNHGESEGSEEEFRPRERQIEGRLHYRHGANATCRRIILQLIAETPGVVPNDPFTLKRISTARWQEAGEEDRPLLKTIKAAIKTLCEQGKLRQMTFAFRGKSGIMLKRSVLFLPKISSRSQSVEEVKEKIIDAEPADYIPPEWISEGSRIPLVSRRAPSGTPEADTPVRRRRRASLATTDSEDITRSTRSTRSQTRASIPTPPPAYYEPATGFLSLKIPSLRSLHAVQLQNWRTQCPVIALLADTGPSNPWRSASFLPARTRRGSRKPRQAGISIVWTTEEDHNFPSSLSDILQLRGLRLKYQEFLSDDLDWQRFACEIEGVRAWEEQKPDSFLSTRSKYAFINHSIPPVLLKDVSHTVPAEFAKLVEFGDGGSEMEVDYPPTESWPAFVSVLQKSPEDVSRIAGVALDGTKPMLLPSKKSTVRRSTRAPKRKAQTQDYDSAIEQRPKRRKRVVGGATAGPSRRTGRTSLTRTPRYLQTLPEEMIYRIAISVVVVRTLAGGIESFIDWPLVMTMFPGEREDFIKDRWKTLFTRYNADIRGLTENLQWKYLRALEAGEVASVNFQDIKTTDWRGIVEWALKNLDKFNAKQIEDLPESREELLDDYNVELGEPRHYYSLLSYNNVATGPTRDDIAGSVVFGTTHLPLSSDAQALTSAVSVLEYAPRHELDAADPDVRLAKSWVLATILTPESSFNSSLARAKLSTLVADPSDCESLLARAAKLLQEDKLIQKSVKERASEELSSVRTWEGHRKLFERFEDRRMINATMLRRAIGYKLDIIDEAFSSGQTILFDKDGIVQDGEMVAVLNLMAMGQIRPKPGADVPRTRYGLDWERVGYRSKNMDKKLLSFSVEIMPTERYVQGDPRAEGRKLPIPRGDADAPRSFIPPWIDIHGNIQMSLWEMFLVGVVGMVVQMPGASALDISRVFGGALDQDTVELILGWCVQGGFAKMDTRSRGYETTEWWWLCLSR